VLSIEFVNQRQSTCLRCEARFRLVLPTRGDQESLAAVFACSRIEFMSALRESTGCGLVDTKAMAEHVVSKLRCCHRCGREIRDRLLVDCPRCRALNIQLGRPMEDVTCPACGFAVLAEGYGSYEICGVCGWEDDGVQLANPTSGGGANAQSLAESQAKIIGRIPLNVLTHGEFQRDPLWRPLHKNELDEAESKRRSQHWHTPAATDRTDVYWLRAPALDRTE
jgi:ribosomal protein S27E